MDKYMPLKRDIVWLKFSTSLAFETIFTDLAYNSERQDEILARKVSLRAMYTYTQFCAATLAEFDNRHRMDF